MSAFAPLSLKNNAAIAVAFAPVGIDQSGVATWMTSSGVYDARTKVTMSMTFPRANTSTIRIKQRVQVPIMDTVDPSKKVGEGYVDISVMIPKNMSESQRLDLRAYADALLTSAVTTAAVQNLESIY